MLERRSVKDDRGERRAKSESSFRVCKILVGAISRSPRTRLPADTLVQTVESRLIAVDEQQTRGTSGRDLPAQLRADRAGGPRDDDPLAAKTLRTRRFASGQVGSAQEIPDVDIPCILNRDMTAYQLRDCGQCPDAGAGALEQSVDATQLLGGGGRDGDDRVLHAVLGDHRIDVVDRTEDLVVVESPAAQCGLIVDQPDDA